MADPLPIIASDLRAERSKNLNLDMAKVKEELRVQLRDFVDPMNRKPDLLLNKLAPLNDVQLTEIFVRLTRGDSVRMVANIVRKWGILGFPLRDLERILTAFITVSSPVLERIKKSAGVKSNSALRASVAQATKDAKLLAEKLDALQELQWAIKAQRLRLEGFIRGEKEKNYTVNRARQDMELYASMLTDYLDLEMRLGIRKEEPKKVDVLLGSEFNQLKQRIGGTAGVDQMKLAGARLIDLVAGADGVFVPDTEDEA